jgi:hypothetical protein
MSAHQHPLMQSLWAEFMRAPFSDGKPIWCWYADTLDARQKKALYDAFCGLSVFVNDHVSRERFVAEANASCERLRAENVGLKAHLAAEQAHRERMLRNGIVPEPPVDLSEVIEKLVAEVPEAEAEKLSPDPRW